MTTSTEPLFGRDLFGDVVAAPAHGPILSDEFMYPPFTVFNAREGWWRERKAAWLSLGIQSEIGPDQYAMVDGGSGYANATGGGRGGALRIAPVGRRDGLTWGCKLREYDHYRVKEGTRDTTQAIGTSVFDPVLCELVYRWFAPVGGSVLDPFAGGSVRGIVAARLGRRYYGIDLRPEQIDANRKQATAICAPSFPDRITISAAQMRQRFNGCEPDYIRDVCHGACCRSTTHPDGILVTIHDSERKKITARGATVVDGRLVSSCRRCPFQDAANLCALHETGDKPFGCVASPFTLSPTGNRLIVRNRYRLLKCYEDGRRIPAYVAFRASLDRILGAATAATVVAHLDAGGGDLEVPIGSREWLMLRDNDAAKHGTGDRDTTGMPTWKVGDARDAAAYPGDYADLIFTCPPYGDLERYSDDARDLSTMTWDQFRAGYGVAIERSAERLAVDRFAVFVVGNYRAADGGYRDLVGETVRVAERAGMRYYNEAVLVTSVGSLPVRAGRQFRTSRKLGKTHQNVLVFVKGDWRKAAAACGAVGVGEIQSETNGGDL